MGAVEYFKLINLILLFIKMTDDTIIRNRLNANENGVRKILRNYIKFQHVLDNGVKEEIEIARNNLEQEILLYQQNITNANRTFSAQKREKRKYEEEIKEVETSIESTNEDISKLRNRRKLEEKLRGNREEYTALVKIISNLPSRQNSIKDIEKITESLNTLKEEYNNNEKELELRNKQFRLLLHSISEIEKEFVLEEKVKNNKKMNDNGENEENDDENDENEMQVD